MKEDVQPRSFENKPPVMTFIAAIPLLALAITGVVLFFLPMLKGGIDHFEHDLTLLLVLIGSGAIATSFLWFIIDKNTPRTVSVGEDGYTLEFASGRLTFVPYSKIEPVKPVHSKGLFKEESGRGIISFNQTNGGQDVKTLKSRIAQAISDHLPVSKGKETIPNSDPVFNGPDPVGSGDRVHHVDPGRSVMVSKGRLTNQGRSVVMLLPICILVILFISLREGLTVSLIMFLLIGFIGFQMVRKLIAFSRPVLFREDGLEINEQDDLMIFTVGTLRHVFVRRDEISLIHIAPSLERKRFQSQARNGRSDMVVSTRSGKDFFLMKRPTNELIAAAALLGFDPNLTSRSMAPIPPAAFHNPVDMVLERKVLPLVYLFVAVGMIYVALTILVFGFFSLVVVVTSSILFFVSLFLYAALIGITRKSSKNPVKVCVGMNGMTLVFRNGSTNYVDFADLDFVLPMFRVNRFDHVDRLKRGYMRAGRRFYSISPEITIAVREAYRSNQGHYPSFSSF